MRVLRPLHVYVLGYFALVLGAGLALWQAGVLSRLPGGWALLAALLAVGLGVLLLVTAARPPVNSD